MAKVLIILEEDLFLGNVINEKIKKEGFETLFINNGAIGVEQMKIFKPDMVVMDMNLQTISPYQLLENKKDKPEISSIPTIIISSSGDVDEIKKSLDLGVKDYIVKSQFNAEELVAKIKNILSTSEKTKQTSTAKNDTNSIEGRKVMWVEDDQFLSDLIARKLNQQKCKLLFSRTGEEAIEILEKDQPDIVLLDLLLPGISGFEVLEHIKKSDKLKHIPVIVLSNFTQNNEIERTRALGASRFLTKATVILDDIVREIQNVLKEEGK